MSIKVVVDDVRLRIEYHAQWPGPLSAVYAVLSQVGPVQFPSDQSMRHLARKYLKSAIRVETGDEAGLLNADSIVIHIKPATDKDSRAAFLGALAAKTKLVPG